VGPRVGKLHIFHTVGCSGRGMAWYGVQLSFEKGVTAENCYPDIVLRIGAAGSELGTSSLRCHCIAMCHAN